MAVPAMRSEGLATRMAKSLIPLTGACVARFRMQGLLRYVELGASLLQGKGSGSGWDMSSELRAAAACISRPDPVLLDVGANYGRWTLGMVRRFPGAQKVVLVEPQPDCLSELERLEIPAKSVVACAVSDHAGTEPFYISGAGWGAASLYERSETFFSNRVQQRVAIPVTTLDDILEGEQIDFVDFAKFDIEGGELAAFRGATRSFCRHAIGALSFEFGSGNINSRTFFRDFWEFLTGHGFEIFRILPGGRTTPIREYYEDLEYFRGVSNYICRSKLAQKAKGLAARCSETQSLCVTA